MRNGSRSILAALDQPMIWLVDVGTGMTATAVWVGALSDLPQRMLPASDVMLYAHLIPMLRLRALGPVIEPGSLPARVVKSLVGGAENAVRWLTNYVTDRDQVGRPPEDHEVAFRAVDPSSGKLLEMPARKRLFVKWSGCFRSDCIGRRRESFLHRMN